MGTRSLTQMEKAVKGLTESVSGTKVRAPCERDEELSHGSELSLS